MDITDILTKRGIEYKKTNNPYEIVIACPSGEHEDRNPSLSYNLESNIFNCWSCGFKGGSTKFLQAIGEQPNLDLDTKQPYKIAKLRKKIDSILYQNSITIPEDAEPYLTPFREISTDIYKEFEAFTTNQQGLSDYLCFPIYQNGKLKFLEGRLLRDLPSQPKYYRRPQNITIKDILFPLDKVKSTNYVILVEGLFDLLNMWDLGYHNTLCTFGSTNFGRDKVKLLDSRGITRVDIMMDPDLAGEKAANIISSLLDTANIDSRIIQLPAGIDPGELTKKQAEAILR